MRRPYECTDPTNYFKNLFIHFLWCMCNWCEIINFNVDLETLEMLRQGGCKVKGKWYSRAKGLYPKCLYLVRRTIKKKSLD